jgi:hypothetical protein
MIPETTRESVIGAMRRFDQELRNSSDWKDWENKDPYKYAIEFEGGHYPVKAIVSMAADTPVGSFSGGDEANNRVKELGFQVITLRRAEEHGPSVQQNLEEILNRYADARLSGTFGKSHPIWGAFKRLRNGIENLPALRNRPTLRVQWSAGKGEWARVPWIAIIDSREIEAPSGGLNCVFLFREDLSAAYLTLNQGVTKPREELGPFEASRVLKQRAQEIRPQVANLRQRNFLLDDHIDLRTGGIGAKYEDATIAYKIYEVNKVPPDIEIAEDLETLLSEYSNILRSVAPHSTWIFQANPRLYDIDAAVAHLSEMTWLVSSHQDQIHPGDKVYVWKSGADAGIIAEATVLSSPTVLEEMEAEAKFALDPEKFKGTQLRVQLHIDGVISPLLARSVLKAHTGLEDLSIIKQAQGTNFVSIQNRLY